MSRYTLDLGEICGVMTGHNIEQPTGNPFDYFDDVITDAIPLIVSSRISIYDDDVDKEALLHKIFEHYWEYEVCTYTPADFVRRFNRKLSEIMPYYNQLYATAKKEFDPFEDVNYYTNAASTEKGENSKRGENFVNHGGQDKDTTKNRGTDTDTTTHTGDDVVDTTSNSTSATQQINKSDTSSSTTSNENVTSEETTESAKDTKTSADSKGDSKSNSTTKSTSKTESESTTDTDSTTQSNTDRTEQKSGGPTTTNTDNTNSKDSDYYNDTPQGQISQIDNGYLTHYENHVHQGQGGTTISATSDTSRVVIDDDNTTTVDTSTTDNSTAETTSESTTTASTSDTSSSQSFGNETATGNKVNTADKDGTTQTDSTETGKSMSTTNDTDDGSTTTTYDTETKTTKEYGADFETVRQYGANSHQTDVAEDKYAKDNHNDSHVHGKFNSGRTYAEMIQQWRDILINIDMQVINDLKPLFFKIV